MIETFRDFSSSNILELGYDPSTQTVYVTFHKDGNPTSKHKYWRVERADFDVIRTASSVGGAVNRYLVRGGLYSHAKVVEA